MPADPIAQPIPAVSIVVPVYNGMPYLPATIEALLGQSFADFELLILDDGSTDGSRDYVAGLADPRIRLIVQANGGLCAAMHRLLAEARAPLVVRNDQDDISLPDRVARQVAMLGGDWDLLFCMIEKIGDKRSWANDDQEKAVPGKVTTLEPLRDGSKLHSTMIGRTTVLRALGYRDAFYPCDDYDLLLRAEESCRMGFLHEKLVRYRFHPKASTHGRFRMMQDRSRWTEACALARRAGGADMSYAAFAATLARQPLWRRLNRTRKDAYRWAQRAGGESWLNGRDVRAAAMMATAALLAPERIGKRVARAVGLRI